MRLLKPAGIEGCDRRAWVVDGDEGWKSGAIADAGVVLGSGNDPGIDVHRSTDGIRSSIVVGGSTDPGNVAWNEADELVSAFIGLNIGCAPRVDVKLSTDDVGSVCIMSNPIC